MIQFTHSIKCFSVRYNHFLKETGIFILFRISMDATVFQVLEQVDLHIAKNSYNQKSNIYLLTHSKRQHILA